MIKTKIISLFLVVAMLFSFATVAFAASADLKTAIVDEAEFTVRNYGETKTVYIEVYIEEYPELANISMINSVSKLLYEKQAEYAEDSYVLMSRNHIAGELALHVLLFRFFYILGASDESSVLHDKYYVGSKNAMLNIDEDRISPALIEMVGTMITWFGFNLEDELEDAIDDSILSDSDITLGDIIS